MNFERYRLTLHHEILSDGETIQLDPPLTLALMIDTEMRKQPKGILVPSLIDKFKDELMTKWTGW